MSLTQRRCQQHIKRLCLVKMEISGKEQWRKKWISLRGTMYGNCKSYRKVEKQSEVNGCSGMKELSRDTKLESLHCYQDYDETFCPVVRFESLRMLIAVSVQNDLTMHQMDITLAFLNGDLKEEVYMWQPEGFVVKGKECKICTV